MQASAGEALEIAAEEAALSIVFAAGGPLLGRLAGMAGDVRQQQKYMKAVDASHAFSRASRSARELKRLSAFDEVRRAATLEGTVRILKEAGIAKDVIADLIRGGFICFAAGTRIPTEDGWRSIEDIRVGDRVWARDEVTGEFGYQPVTQLFETHPLTLVHLTLTVDHATVAHTLSGTKTHPIWSIDRQTWVPMGNLESGEHLLLADGQAATVESMEVEQASDGAFTTHNFTVANWNTYFAAPALSSRVSVPVYRTCSLPVISRGILQPRDWVGRIAGVVSAMGGDNRGIVIMPRLVCGSTSLDWHRWRQPGKQAKA